jgi:RNA recognition motif-containing protein
VNRFFLIDEGCILFCLPVYPFYQQSIIMRDRDTGHLHGFGFVTFSNEAEAQSTVNHMNDAELDGRKLHVRSANARSGGSGAYNSGY